MCVSFNSLVRKLRQFVKILFGISQKCSFAAFTAEIHLLAPIHSIDIPVYRPAGYGTFLLFKGLVNRLTCSQSFFARLRLGASIKHYQSRGHYCRQNPYSDIFPIVSHFGPFHKYNAIYSKPRLHHRISNAIKAFKSDCPRCAMPAEYRNYRRKTCAHLHCASLPIQSIGYVFNNIIIHNSVNLIIRGLSNLSQTDIFNTRRLLSNFSSFRGVQTYNISLSLLPRFPAKIGLRTIKVKRQQKV
jgi:hypothetical protein